MAILNRGILGGGRNAVGTVVMTQWKGKDVIRSRVSPSNPNTPAQERTRSLFRQISALASGLMDAFVRPYWTRWERGTTAYNEFMRANQRVMRSLAVPGLGAPGEYDAVQAILTRGPLAPVEVVGIADGGASAEVAWDPGAGEATDRVAVVVLDIASSTLVSVNADLARGDEEAALGFAYADRARYAVHVLAFRDGAGGDARSATLSVNSSAGFDEMGALVVVSARDRIAALAEGARQSQAAPVAAMSALGHGGGNDEPTKPPPDLSGAGAVVGGGGGGGGDVPTQPPPDLNG